MYSLLQERTKTREKANPVGILLLLGIVIGLNVIPVFVTSAFLRQALIAEQRFHLLVDKDQVRVVAGKRRKPLQVSEAEAHLTAIEQVVRKYRWSWSLVLWRLYGPKQMRVLDSDLDKVRKHAVDSQRQDLLIKAMEKGYDNDLVMTLLMKAQTDESFKILRERIEAGSPGVPIKITANEAKISTESMSHRNADIVLMSVGKKALPPAKAQVQAIAQPGSGVPLPAGYSWDLGWKNKGMSYEQMVVILRGPKGYKVREENFYTSVYGTPYQQKHMVREYQKKLALSAHHDMHKDGIDKSLLG